MRLPVEALRHRDFRFYWLGTFAWIMGEFFRFLAQGWLVFELTGDAFYLGLVSAAGAVPTILMSPIAGVVADRIDRRRILMASQTITGSIMVTIGVLVLTGRIEVWQIMTAAVLAGITQGFDEPARQSLVPNLVPAADLPSAISLGNGVWSISQIAAPGLAGVVLAAWGAGPCYLVTAAGFWTSVILMALVRVPRRSAGADRQSAWQDMRDGFAFVRRQVAIRSLLIISLSIGAFGYSSFVLFPVFATEILHTGSIGFGAMYVISGVGGLVGTLWAARLGFSRHRGLLLLASASGFGVLLIAFAASRSLAVSLAILAGVGLVDGMFINLALTVAQSMLPDEMRGRIMGLWGITWFVPPLGGMAGGWLAGAIGAPATVAVFGGIVAALTLVVGTAGVRALAGVAVAPELREPTAG